MLGMTADVKVNKNHNKVDKVDHAITTITQSLLVRRYFSTTNQEKYHIHLAQDCVLHSFNEYFLEDVDKSSLRLRTCRFGFGQEEMSNMRNTLGKELQHEAKIEKSSKVVEHLLFQPT